MSESTFDYDEEAKKLFKALLLNNQGAASSASDTLIQRGYRDLDVIWQHPITGARLYVGNISAAQNLDTLRKRGINRVVNCQDPSSENYHEKLPEMKYFRFNISYWFRAVGSSPSPESVLKFFKPFHTFCLTNLSANNSVLIHCLAGAHRAGTAGVSCLMVFDRLDFCSAVNEAKRKRSIIDPIGNFPELLRRLEDGIRLSGLELRQTYTTLPPTTRLCK